MFFGYSASDVPAISTWADAKAYYNATKPWRGSLCRPLDGRRKKHIYMHERADESFACVLYNTSVVVYRKTGEIVLTPWTSQMTDVFVNALLRKTNISTNFLHRCITLGGKLYRTEKAITLTLQGDTYVPAFTPEPWKMVRLDIKAFNTEKKKYHVGDFKAWMEMYVRLNEEKVLPRAWYSTPKDLLEALSDRRYTDALVFCITSYHDLGEKDIRRVYENVKQAIIAIHKTIIVTEREYLESRREFDRYKRGEKYLYLVRK